MLWCLLCYGHNSRVFPLCLDVFPALLFPVVCLCVSLLLSVWAWLLLPASEHTCTSLPHDPCSRSTPAFPPLFARLFHQPVNFLCQPSLLTSLISHQPACSPPPFLLYIFVLFELLDRLTSLYLLPTCSPPHPFKTSTLVCVLHLGRLVTEPNSVLSLQIQNRNRYIIRNS